MLEINLSEQIITITSMKIFRYNTFFAWDYFYKVRFNFQLLANTVVSNNVNAAVKPQTSVAKWSYLLPLLN